jgi:tRNA(Arg) A34 adenosine deaminase TadA
MDSAMTATDAKMVDRLLEVIERDIVPKTAEAVSHGNKLFGAAILNKERQFAGDRRNQQRDWKIRSGMARSTA